MCVVDSQIIAGSQAALKARRFCRFWPLALLIAAIHGFFGLQAWAEPMSATSNHIDDGLEKLVRPFFKQHCTACHGEHEQEGNLRVDNLILDLKSPGGMAHWEEIMHRMNSGDMPPADEARPSPADVATVGQWILGQLHEAETLRQSSAGQRISFHKLSREEYGNTIRDLLGVSFDVTAPTGLPEDPDWHGFQRIGSALTLSPAHVEKHFKAADAILEEALSLRREPKRNVIHWDSFHLRGRNFKEEYEARGIADQARIEIVPNNYHTDTWPVEIKETGEYRLRIQLSGLRPVGGRPPRLKVFLPSIGKTLLERDVDAPEDKPITLEAYVHLNAGNYPVFLKNAVPGPNPEARRSRHSQTANAFTNTQNRVPWQIKLTDDNFQPIEPTLILDSVEWEGPIVDSWPTKAHQRIFVPGNEDMAHAREILAQFAERAWRRPVQPGEIEPLLKPVEVAIGLGKDFPTAVRSGLLAILCSKSFLYLVEGDAKTYTPELSDWELASRLSYFLWSSMPDERLFDLARSGTLRQPKILAAEVRRMLADEKGAAFAESFPRQWLQLRKVGMFPPDERLYPDYDENLEQSMIAETVAYFGEVLNTNDSIRQFLNSDWTMLNERLAMHYGIEGVRGDQMRRVPLRAEDHRGGLLTHGSILSLTSDGTRHRPVHRGVWVMESIIGKPVPPPPANVPALDTPTADTTKSTIREKLELHRADPNCAACHAKIDPLGIAFDRYDAIGRWRTIENVSIGQGANPELDPSGVLHDGRAFADSVALRKFLQDDTDQFALAFTEKLATYALRRGMTFSDRAMLESIVVEAQSNDYRLASLIEMLVTSPLFLKR